NLVPDKGSRFREGGITGDQDAFIDKTRCAEDGLAPTTNASRQGQTDFAIGIFPNYLSWLCQTQNTPIWPQKGAECEPYSVFNVFDAKGGGSLNRDNFWIGDGLARALK
ncbi:MAG: hypothetical protein ACLQPD_13375, partial [Desulfomonilaceae bacterium]